MILIVCAMEEEASEIKKTIVNLKEEKITDNKIYYKGFINNKEIVLMVTGIGKVNAAIFTSLMLQKYDFEYVLNIGYAGGVKPYSIGDILIIKEASYHDVDLSLVFEKYQRGELPNIHCRLESDHKLLDEYKKKLNVDVEVLYTGDKFMLEKAFPTTGIYDMEGASIYHTCFLFNKKIIAIKLISDVLEVESQLKDYDKFESTVQTIIKDIVVKVI